MGRWRERWNGNESEGLSVENDDVTTTRLIFLRRVREKRSTSGILLLFYTLSRIKKLFPYLTLKLFLFPTFFNIVIIFIYFQKNNSKYLFVILFDLSIRIIYYII